MLDTLRNAIDYPLRQLIRWRRGGLHFRNEPKAKQYAHLPMYARGQAEAAAQRLRVDYHLHDLYQHSPVDNYCENLFYLELLEAAFNRAEAHLPMSVSAADIGVSHWFYVQALHALLTRWEAPAGRTLTLRGYEADPYRVYANLHSRYDHALAHIRELPNTRFIPEAFTEQRHAFDVVTMLFPFVFVRDHLRWGLPRPAFAPDALLTMAWRSVKPGGLLLIVNQGEAEHAAQKEKLAALNIIPIAAFRHESLLYEYDLPRYVLAARA